MDSNRDQIQYIINPETERKIKVGGPTWRRLTTKYYTNSDGSFTDQLIPDSRTYRTNKVWDKNTNSMKTARKPKHPTPRKRVSDPKGERKYLIVGSKSWNDRYLEYKWNGHEFGAKRRLPLSEFTNTVAKRREVRRMSYNDLFDLRVSIGRTSDVTISDLIYALTYYNTLNKDMFKEWMNVKRSKKDFRIRYDIDEDRLWVRLPDGSREQEVIPLNLILNERDKEEFKKIAKKYITNGMRDYSQCFTDIMAYNLMKAPQNSELKILNLTDDRLGHLRIVHKDRIDEWLDDYLKWYSNAVEEQETEGSGFVYLGWIGFHIDMAPLRTDIGYKHHTPSVLGRTVINPNIDDNRCLQRCLILASEDGQKIIENRKMGDSSVYNKWWKHPDKYKIFNHTIHEIEEAMDICDNKPFEQNEEKFAQLESLLKVSINVFEVTLLPEYDDNSKDKYDQFVCSQIYCGQKGNEAISLCILNDVSTSSGADDTRNTTLPKHFLFIKDLASFKRLILRRNDAKNNHLARTKKCRFCDFVGSASSVHTHEVQSHRDQIDECELYDLSNKDPHLRFVNQRYEMPAPIVVYADFESAIHEDGKHKPIMLSCLPVSRIPAIQTMAQVF